MSEKGYWKTEWDKRKTEGANNFAKRSFSHIKEKKFMNLLELGCGDGRDTLYFSGKGLRVTAVDFSESGIRKLKESVRKRNIKNIKIIKEDIRKISFKENSFYVIYAHLSLHYFDDKATTHIMDRLCRVLKKNGRLFIKCKSTQDALYGKGKKVGQDMYAKGHIRHFFSTRYMKEKLSKFKILKIRETYSEYHQHKSAFIEVVATKA